MASATTLTPHDATTLSLLFDPESSPSPSTAPISPSLPPDPHYPPSLIPSLQKSELAAITLAQTDPAAALPLFNTILSTYPAYASGFNNRAQLRRLLSHPVEEIVADLEKAIELASPAGGVLAETSELQGKVLQQAWTQLGVVMLGEGREEDAVKAFTEGARFGGEIAKGMCVKLNPVARLCGSIVKEAMREEMMVG
ncbi:hypothetical protein K440DRAFT_628214 [Wilcoxina mikolae CBS 423.85]|nr:hypothetical protein K440DRAFT_628214 [Wilcoxina mikolae CBS 423.85]